MRIGIVLPNFAWSPDRALERAGQAAAAGLDGVFCYDHLWPMHDRSRPALAPFPLLASIAERHRELFVGPLVARIGLVADEVLLSQFAALEAVSPGRVIAAMGTGDRLSAEENLAYGVAYGTADERRASLERCASALGARGNEVWIGGGAPATMAIAERLGAAVNLWGASVEDVARQAARSTVTWAGPMPESSEQLATLAVALEGAGATWAVFGGVEDPGALARLVGR